MNLLYYEIRSIELLCEYIIELPSYVSYKYDLIKENLTKIIANKSDITVIINDFIILLSANKFIKKFNLYNNEKINNKEQLVTKAKEILSHVPQKYSSVLPL